MQRRASLSVSGGRAGEAAPRGGLPGPVGRSLLVRFFPEREEQPDGAAGNGDHVNGDEHGDVPAEVQLRAGRDDDAVHDLAALDLRVVVRVGRQRVQPHIDDVLRGGAQRLVECVGFRFITEGAAAHAHEQVAAARIIASGSINSGWSE